MEGDEPLTIRTFRGNNVAVDVRVGSRRETR